MFVIRNERNGNTQTEEVSIAAKPVCIGLERIWRKDSDD